MATTYDKASLVMIPSGYKDDKLYSIKPTNGDGDFTFSRDGSGASPATRVNASGLIEKGRENVLLQSNQFDTTWSLVNANLTSGQSGYDGSSNAWLLSVAATTGSTASVRQTTSITAVSTFSVYAKAGNVNFAALYCSSSGSDFNAWFDLGNGVLGSTAGGTIDTTIESVGGGWYRISITGLSPDSQVRIYPSFANSNYSITSGENIYIQDAQLEQGLVATDYIETTTAAVSAGLLGDMPRLDYSGGATCPSLLLEPSRVNIITNSEYIGGSDWTRNGFTLTTNTTETLSPEGVYNASKLDVTNTDPYLLTLPAASVAVGSVTFSGYLKGAGTALGKEGGIYIDFGVGGGTATGTNSSASYTITDEWVRWETTANVTGAGTIRFRIEATNIGAASGDEVYVYGLQAESGSYPTSYIPTYGSAAPRGKDVCIDAGNSSTFNDSEGVLYAEISALANDLSNRLISLTNGTSTERISLFYSQDSSNEVKGIVFVGGVVTGEVEYNVPDITANIKVALKYKANDFALWINGVEVATDSSGAVPSGLDRLNFDLGISGSILPFFGNVKQTIYFPTALTDAELAALTA